MPYTITNRHNAIRVTHRPIIEGQHAATFRFAVESLAFLCWEQTLTGEQWAQRIERQCAINGDARYAHVLAAIRHAMPERRRFTIYAEGLQAEFTVDAPTEREARALLWAGLTDSQRDAVACLDCIGWTVEPPEDWDDYTEPATIITVEGS